MGKRVESLRRSKLTGGVSIGERSIERSRRLSSRSRKVVVLVSSGRVVRAGCAAVRVVVAAGAGLQSCAAVQSVNVSVVAFRHHSQVPGRAQRLLLLHLLLQLLLAHLLLHLLVLLAVLQLLVALLQQLGLVGQQLQHLQVQLH